jgi:hypothetical protein
MKTTKILCAGALALTGVSLASAQTVVKITGSTAFRKSTYFSLVDSVNSPKGAAIGGSGGNMEGAGRAVITGTLKSGPSAGQAVVFEVAWAGSVGGVQVMTQNLSTLPGASFTSAQTWLNASNSLTALTANASTGHITGYTEITGTPAFDAASTADASMSDSFQSSTSFQNPVLNDYQDPSAFVAGVGIVEFVWAKGMQNPSIPTASYNALTNASPLALQNLLGNGIVPLSVFTGNNADEAYDVVLVGRNNDSGTRLDAEAETGYGFGQTENQYQPVGNPISSLTNVGNNGYASGGNVATALNTTVASSATDSNGKPFILLGYVGVSDNANVNGGNNKLTYTGVTYSQPSIREGDYTFWSYEHLLTRTSLSGVKLNAVNAVGNTIVTADANYSGVTLSTMNVLRTIEGGVPVTLF